MYVRIYAVSVAAVLALGLSACSQGPLDTTASISPSVPSPPPVPPPPPVPSPPPPPLGTPTVKVLSNRPDLISGGDALVEIQMPTGASAAVLHMDVDGRDVSDAFAQRADGRVLGLLTGLALGRNVVTARVAGGGSHSLDLINHPNGGPVFSGPQIQPWVCQTTAIDAQCNEPAQYHYVYKSTDSSKSGLQTYDPTNPATDVAMTTTDQGVTVPFIVRIETGFQDRDQYAIATLFQTGKAWTPWDPQTQWNHKLLVTHGYACEDNFGAWVAPSVTHYDPVDALGLPASLPPGAVADSIVYALGAGFAVMSTALDYDGHNCNIVVQAESLMMAKEHLVEQYGELRYTIGTGCSGGSLTQQQVANAYPGIYQGILPTCSFPDAWSSATQVMDYHLLRAYLEDSSKWGSGIAWTPDQWADVEGNQLAVDAIASDMAFFFVIKPRGSCWPLDGNPQYTPLLYDAKANPGGVRCGLPDYMVNVLGPRPKAVWSQVEQQIGHGFGGMALDNVGVQYGLAALQNVQITPDQFLDLNRKVGGLDIDVNPVSSRLAADDMALTNAYRSGAIDTTSNLDRTAIIDCRGPDPGAAHDSYRTFAIRARLDREHGGHANQLVWEGPTPIIGDSQCTQTSLIAMDRWLSAIEQDTSAASIAAKIVADKPADLGDQCWDGTGTKVSDGLCPPDVVPVYGTPRTVAGDAIATETNKCQLKPLSRTDNYGPLGMLTFTDAQWAQLQQLFPDGVCDFTVPGVNQGQTVRWLNYQDSTGSVVYGGQALPAAALAAGWAAPAFSQQ